MSKGLCAPDSQGKGETEGLHVEKGHERILISPGWERTRPGQRDLLWAGERWLSKDPIPMGLEPSPKKSLKINK